MKKCKPSMRRCVFNPSPMRLIGKLEELLVSGMREDACCSRSANMRCFSARSSFTDSIASVSTQATTSAVLLNSWRTLQAYSLEEDSQMIHEDAIVPGAAYLGMAKGDHWAVALPFEDVPTSDPLAPFIKDSVNHNHYPRTALFEAALRFVLEDLGALPRR